MPTRSRSSARDCWASTASRGWASQATRKVIPRLAAKSWQAKREKQAAIADMGHDFAVVTQFASTQSQSWPGSHSCGKRTCTGWCGSACPARPA